MKETDFKEFVLGKGAAFNAGWESFFIDRELSDNPHSAGSQFHKDWADGYRAAQACPNSTSTTNELLLTATTIPPEYWDSWRERWNSHAFFHTVNHWHISDYSQDETCEVLVVECKDGRFYIEDNFGGDAKGHADVFNPFDRNSFPVFFSDFPSVNEAAAKIVASITGGDYQQFLIKK